MNNTTGDGPGAGYQAGISDQGDKDSILSNSVCGIGYTPVASPPPYLFAIDTTFTNNPIVKSNKVCSTSTVVTNALNVNSAVAGQTSPQTAPKASAAQ